MRILSVDLANTSYSNFGIVALDAEDERVVVRRFAPNELRLSGTPSARHFAETLAVACERLQVSVVLLDGPQGWKHPKNGLTHSRVCERALNTPGKTGLPGMTKPANYLGFISFSVEVFDGLVGAGFRLFSGRCTERLLVESFPLSAWKQLGLMPLRAKARSKPADLVRAAHDLGSVFPVLIPEGLNHDELQALVAAFAGLALARSANRGYATAGIAPSVVDGTWREGFIVNPTRYALARQSGGS